MVLAPDQEDGLGVIVLVRIVDGTLKKRQMIQMMKTGAHYTLDRVGVFTYSDEEGTHGYDLDGKVPARIMRTRRAKLMREQAKISKKKIVLWFILWRKQLNWQGQKMQRKFL